jgi:glycerol-3-phosphate O-acyltransferase
MTRTMGDLHDRDPWPASGPVVFLCDAGTRQERSLLSEWLRTTAPAGADLPPDTVFLSLDEEATDGRHGVSRVLRSVLDRPQATTLVPLRVGWLPARDSTHSAPRLRDLLTAERRDLRNPLGHMLRRQDPSRARYIVGAPATLAQLHERYDRRATTTDGEGEDFEGFVARQAAIALDVVERSLRGRRYKVPRSVIAGVESSGGYKAATDRLAAGTGRSPADVRSEARTYLAEMVATPTRFYIDWMGMLARWITSLGYQQIVTDPDNIERARQIVRDHPSALLWTHKSHVDAIALLSVMYDNDFPAPHTIGGINMAFPGVAHTGRRSGTVYIRRSFSDNPVYKLALQQYLGFLMEKRFPLSWAFEGTRSRNGKLGRPRYGLVKYVIEAAHDTETESLHILPVSISYDLIGETSDYAREESGQPKEVESLGWFMQYLRKLRSPKGNIYLDFAEPVVLDGPAPDPTDDLLAEITGQVARRVNDVVPVTLTSVMCMALLGAAPRALTYAELDRAIRMLLTWLRDHQIRLEPSLDKGDLPELHSLAEHVFAGGVVQRVSEGSLTLFEIGEGQYPVASYYSNTIVHYFVDKALAEVTLAVVADVDPAARPEAFWDELAWLRDITRLEFYHVPESGLRSTVDGHLSAYEPEWADLLAGSSGDVLALLGRLRPLVSHAALLPVFEAYWLVAKVVMDRPGPERPTEADVVADALRLGRAAVRRRRVSSPASMGKATFKAAYTYLDQHGLLDGTDEAARAAGQALVARLEDAIRRVRHIGELAHADLFTLGEAGAAPG